LLSTIGLMPGGSSTVHVYTQTIQRTTQLTFRRRNYFFNFSTLCV